MVTSQANTASAFSCQHLYRFQAAEQIALYKMLSYVGYDRTSVVIQCRVFQVFSFLRKKTLNFQAVYALFLLGISTCQLALMNNYYCTTYIKWGFHFARSRDMGPKARAWLPCAHALEISVKAFGHITCDRAKRIESILLRYFHPTPNRKLTEKTANQTSTCRDVTGPRP